MMCRLSSTQPIGCRARPSSAIRRQYTRETELSFEYQISPSSGIPKQTGHQVLMDVHSLSFLHSRYTVHVYRFWYYLATEPLHIRCRHYEALGEQLQPGYLLQ